MTEAETAPRGVLRRLGRSRWLLAAALLVVLVAWGRGAGRLKREFGLFGWLGNDFAYYYTQATALREGRPAHMYDLKALTYMRRQLIKEHGRRRMRRMRANQNPLPPLVFWCFRPFTYLSPPRGFGLWTALNAVAGGLLSWLALTGLPAVKRRWWTLVLATSYPMVVALLFGQIQILLTVALAGAYAALRARRDFLAGLCLALVMIKPQYAFLLGLVLLWKRRWLAVAGAALGGLVIAAGSWAVSSLETVRLYLGALQGHTYFRSDFPSVMVNWRSLVLSLWPSVDDSTGMALTLGLASVTVLLALVAWRGAWDPASRRFPARMGLLFVATLLASHHSHPYGATILIAPAAGVLVVGLPRRLTWLSILAVFALPTLVSFVTLMDIELSSRALLACLLVCFVCLLVESLRPREAESGGDLRGAAGSET